MVSLFLVLAVGSTIVAGVTYYDWCQGSGGPRTPVSFIIPSGATGGDVVASLASSGVIRCDLVSRFIVKRHGLPSVFEAGNYKLTTNMTLDAALATLAKGPLPPAQHDVAVTIPPGYRLTQIAQVVQQQLGIPSKQFLAAAQSGTSSLPPYLPAGKKSLEGFLFPNTYDFAKGQTTAEQVIQAMLDGFKAQVAGLNWGAAAKLGVSPYQVVTIASMIEREAKLQSDRPKISSVIYNRLGRKMPLGIDATIAYIDPNPANGLTVSDLAIKSPYNTRLHPGLPPTPIASPGLQSLKAALNPARTNYLYYVLCYQNGGHAFAPTYKQFLSLERTCLG